MFKVLLLCSVVATSYARKAPFITPCHASDEACLISSSQAALPFIADGIPDLGIPPADPLIMDDVKSEQDGLNIQFKNLQVVGTKQCKFQKMSVTNDNSLLKFEMDCPVTATGQYNVGGKLLVIDIEGNGDFEIKTDKVKINAEAHLENVDGPDGQKHWHIKELTHSYDPLEQVHFRLDNLFGGNEEKAKPVLEFLNHGWRDVTLTIGKPIIDEIVAKFKDHINNFLAVVPSEELHLA